jgi:ABC-2 type transport system ATP-binding protein
MSFEALELREHHPETPRLVGVAPLELFDVHKAWGRKRRQQNPVLRGVDLTLDPGDFVWIGGKNGAGKTTLLRVASGLIAAERGSVLAHGLDPGRDRREFQQRVAFLSAGNQGLYARLTVRIQVDTWARINFVDRRARRAAVERALEQFELIELADLRCDRISMGQRQRVRLAMTFVSNPNVVLLDEPGTSLDDQGHRLLGAAIERLLRRDGAVLWVSPARVDWKAQADYTRRYLLEGGKLEAL